MRVLNNVMGALNGKMTTPRPFGWFHLLMIGIISVTAIIICIVFHQPTERQTKTILLSLSSVCIAFEIYKQLIFSYDAKWKYPWYIFPFQFCSTPMYIAFLSVFLKKGKFRDYLYNFLATFGLFAGLSVIMFPAGVFTETIGVNIQTMVHHGIQVIMGAFLISSKQVDGKFSNLIRAIVPFSVLLAIAEILNYSVYLSGIHETFNMFYISPFFTCTLPVLSIIQKVAPYPIFVLSYFLIFSALAYATLLIFDKTSVVLEKPYQKYLLKKQRILSLKTSLISGNKYNLNTSKLITNFDEDIEPNLINENKLINDKEENKNQASVINSK